jgi:hypothetical protein
MLNKKEHIPVRAAGKDSSVPTSEGGRVSIETLPPFVSLPANH